MKPDLESQEQKSYKYFWELEINTFGVQVKHPDLTPMLQKKKSVSLDHVCKEEEAELGGAEICGCCISVNCLLR